MVERQSSHRSIYRRFVSVSARWNDVDIFGHLNNAVFYELFDTAILRLLTECGAIGRDAPMASLVAESGAVFHREVLFNDAIEIGIRPERIGRTSLVYALGAFTSGRGDSAVDGRVVHVFVDRTTRQPCPIPDAARFLFEGLVS